MNRELSEINKIVIEGANAAGFVAEIKPVVDIHDQSGNHVASVFTKDKYIQFNEGFTQFGYAIPIFKTLMDSGYESNHT